MEIDNLKERSVQSISNSLHSLAKNILNSIDKTLLNEKRYTIDRFENDVAVCEEKSTQKMVDIPISLLPQNVKEQDILSFIDGIYTINLQATNLAKENILDKTKESFKN